MRCLFQRQVRTESPTRMSIPVLVATSRQETWYLYRQQKRNLASVPTLILPQLYSKIYCNSKKQLEGYWNS